MRIANAALRPEGVTERGSPHNKLPRCCLVQSTNRPRCPFGAPVGIYSFRQSRPTPLGVAAPLGAGHNVGGPFGRSARAQRAKRLPLCGTCCCFSCFLCRCPLWGLPRNLLPRNSEGFQTYKVRRCPIGARASGRTRCFCPYGATTSCFFLQSKTPRPFGHILRNGQYIVFSLPSLPASLSFAVKGPLALAPTGQRRPFGQYKDVARK